MRISIVVGNPKSGSRTLRVATAVADALSEHGVIPDARHVIDLADIANDLFDFDSTAVKEELETVSSSELVVVASPTYKATYTGLLKAFLDRYGNNALADTVCIPVMTGAAPIHALAPEVHLRPLLVELGASTPTRGLFVTEDQFDDLDQVIAGWAATAGPLVKRAMSSHLLTPRSS